MKRIAIAIALILTAAALPQAQRECFAQAESARSAVQQEYAEALWSYLQRNSYTTWSSSPSPIGFEFGPPVQLGVSYLNSVASSSMSADGAVVVTEHYDAAGNRVGVSAWRKSHVGYNPKNQDWYWAHFSPAGQVVQTSADNSPFERPGFVAFRVDNYLWVFDINSPDLQDFQRDGELAKHTTNLGVGPQGITVKAPDSDTILRYIAAKKGFHTFVRDGRLWIFSQWSGDLEEFVKSGELAKHTTLLGKGPLGMTVRAPDRETIDAYIYSKPGFHVQVADGRLWVFRTGSAELADFQATGDLVKRVTQIGVGPDGATLIGPDDVTLEQYLTAADGFKTIVGDDGRLWVFRQGSTEHQDFVKDGELAKRITRLGAGPGGMTVNAPDQETLDDYLRSIGL